MLSKRWKDINDNITDPNSNARKAYNFFVDNGYSPAQSAGIVGNLAQESTVALDSSIENSIGAFGIAQWLGPRRKALEKFASDRNIAPNDFDLQLDFILHELNTSEKRANKSLLSASTPSEAAASFVNKFERSGEKAGEKGFDRRLNFANSMFTTFNEDGTEFASRNSDILDRQIDDKIKGRVSLFKGMNKTMLANNSINPLDISSDPNEVNFAQDVIGLDNKLESQVASTEKIDSVKAALQEKINQRNFIIDFISSTEVPFIERKTVTT